MHGVVLAACGLVLGPFGCGRESAPRGRFILISLDTLRADHLGAYGYRRPTSPFLDSLAARGTLFENAVVQLPGTLPSHMSIFTGLYPPEHGVYPESALSPLIRTLPEVLRAQGFRTAGHTEGGYMAGRYGFARGFEEWTDTSPMVERDGGLVKSPEAVKRTLRRGLESLSRVRGADAFFLLLHTYSTHDPYDPPERYRSRYWSGPPPPGAFAPRGAELGAFNQGERTLAPRVVEYYEALYDAQINYTDDALREFFVGLDELGLRDSVTVIITSDHGEEFLEHGKLVHEQVYHEGLHVPLMVLRPGHGARRVPTLVQSIDLAPTIYELAGIPVAARPSMSGRSLVPLLDGDGAHLGRDAYAEAFVTGDRAVYRQTDEGLFQYVRRAPRQAEDGVWVSRSTSLETFSPELAFWAMSYHEPRVLRIAVDGKPAFTEPLDVAGRWVRVSLPRDGKKKRVELESASCVSPASVGASEDARCLSFQLKGLLPSRSELYDVTRDPLSKADLSSARSDLGAKLAARLDEIRFHPVAKPVPAPLTPEQEERLRALGYLR